MWKIFRKVMLVLTLAVLLCAGFCTYQGWIFLQTPAQTPGQEILIDITPGMNLQRISQSLQDKHIITDALKFRLLVRWKHHVGNIQAGRFALNSGWMPEQVLDWLVNGKPVLTRVTIPEGFTYWQTAELLERNGLVNSKVFQTVIHDPQFLLHYGIPFASAEGFLMPDTYLLKPPREDQTELSQARSVAGRLVDNFWRKMKPFFRDEKIDRDTLKTSIILASIIEKETALESERKRIAGVYTNRILRQMLLQADPTVIYGLGPTFNGNLTKANLNDESNPYNTYKRPGLPPGPICSFSVSALSAALAPEAHNFLYFCAITDGGAHTFSTNLEEHNKAVKRYLQNRHN